MRRAPLLAAAALLALTATARASDPIGIYGLVEKVVLEPSTGQPERAQVWGAFRLAKTGGGDEYQEPAGGYLYYALVPGKEADCRREWADLKSVAGTGEVVAFGARYEPKGTVRKAAEKPDKPDPYALGFGLQKMAPGGRIAKELRSLALPEAPADGGEVAAGPVTLRARHIADKERRGTQYVFAITNPAGDVETSQPLAPPADKDVASWTPKTMVKAGEQYSWQVFAVAADWRGPVLTSTFKGKSAR
jgi:hypothetical protein